MADRKHDKDDRSGQANAFQINDEPATDIEQSDDKKMQKPEGEAFQINGDTDEDPKAGHDDKR